MSKCTPRTSQAILLLGATCIALLTLGCITENGERDLDPDPPRPLKGVSLTPRSSDPEDFTGFFEKAVRAGDVVSWVGDWGEFEKEDGGAPRVISGLAPTHGFIPLVVAQFFTQPSGRLLRPLTPETRESYIRLAAKFAGEFQPEYLGLGVEVNVLYEKSPSDFDGFVSLFSDACDEVRAISPGTKVFTVFQLERMKGLNGGLFGGTNDPSLSQWHLLDLFGKSDLFAFTTYPGLVHRSPELIPTGYYSEISSYTEKPVAFTEIGWHSKPSPTGWESSEEEQAEFIGTFFDLTGELDCEFLIWSFLYDPDAAEPFDSMGLCSRDGRDRPAWHAWIGS